MGWKLDEAGGLVLTVAILWYALHAGAGRGGPGGRGDLSAGTVSKWPS